MKENSIVNFKIEIEEVKQIACPVFWGKCENGISAFAC